MHLLKNERPVPMGGNMALVPGEYIMEDVDAGMMMSRAGGGECELTPFRECAPLFDGHNSEDPITVIRPGRFGDLILLTPCLREIKRRWAKCPLRVACLPQYRDAIIGLAYIDDYPAYPLAIRDSTDCMVSLETSVAMMEREKDTHMTDLFAERLGLGEITDKKPDFFLSNDERNWAHDAYPKDKKQKRVAIQVKSSTPSRDYPPAQMAKAISRLEGRGWDVLLLGLPHEIRGANRPQVINCANDQLSFRQSAAVLATADVFLGPDSALIHVAGALGVPAVGLFSVVPWKLRTAYCPTTFVIQANKGCDITPCFHAPRSSSGFPLNGPCQKDRKCSALDTIDPHDVVAKVENWADNFAR